MSTYAGTPSVYGATPTRRPAVRGRRNASEPYSLSGPLVGQGDPNADYVDASLAQASGHAATQEWDWFRRECGLLAQRPMTSAETGVRMLQACSRLPGVLADAGGSVPFTSIAGGGGSAGISPELLPLPVPAVPVVSASEMGRMFPVDGAPSSEGFQLGALSWLHMVIYALNFTYTGSAEPAKGEPSAAQRRAIDLLYEDCEISVGTINPVPPPIGRRATKPIRTLTGASRSMPPAR